MTPEAELLYRHLSKAFQHVEDGEQSLRGHLSLSEGQEIRIGASETTLHYFLLPYLEQFRAAYPHIRLKISNTTTPAALHALREHAIDFAVIIAPVADESIEIHELLEIRDIFIARSPIFPVKRHTASSVRSKRLPYRFHGTRYRQPGNIWSTYLPALAVTSHQISSWPPRT